MKSYLFNSPICGTNKKGFICHRQYRKSCWDTSLTLTQNKRTFHWKVNRRDWTMEKAHRPELYMPGETNYLISQTFLQGSHCVYLDICPCQWHLAQIPSPTPAFKRKAENEGISSEFPRHADGEENSFPLHNTNNRVVRGEKICLPKYLKQGSLHSNVPQRLDWFDSHVRWQQRPDLTH